MLLNKPVNGNLRCYASNLREYAHYKITPVRQPSSIFQIIKPVYLFNLKTGSKFSLYNYGHVNFSRGKQPYGLTSG